MQKYESYKTTNIEWMDGIPADWNEIPLRKVFEDVKDINKNGDDLQMLSLVKDVGIIPYEERGNQGNKSSEKLEKYKIVKKGDFVINKMNAVIGSLGISGYNGLVSPVYYVLRNRDENKFVSRYFELIFKTRPVQKFLRTMAKGIMEIRESVEWVELKNMSLPLPSKDNQKAIVEYVNHIDKLTQDFIQQKEKYIELLKTYKQSKINELVTKGLNPNIEMKDSGIEWLGEIPQHWKVQRLKNIFRYCNRGETPNYVESSDIKVVNQATFSKGFFDEKDIRYHKGLCSKGKLQDGDLIMASTGGGVLGKVHIFNQGEGYMADSHVTIMRGSGPLVSRFFYYFFLTNYDLINGILSEGSTNQIELQREWLRDMPLAYPETNEMEDIVKEVEKFEDYIEEVIKHTRSQIELVQQYRQSLIYELVTGKRKP
jgi:type I restriction enzyme S subunit